MIVFSRGDIWNFQRSENVLSSLLFIFYSRIGQVRAYPEQEFMLRMLSGIRSSSLLERDLLNFGPLCMRSPEEFE